MTENQDEQREYLENINFGDGEQMPEEEPPREAIEPEPEPEPEPDDAEEKARSIGWRPKAEWKGDPDKWVDAKAYLEKGEEILPLLKKDREKLFKEVSTLKQDLRDLMKYHKEDRQRIQEQLRKEHEQELQALRAKQRVAVEEGDTQAYDQLEKERERLEKEPPTVPGQAVEPPPQFDQEMWAEWQQANPWYKTGGTDGYQPLNEMTRVAQAMAFRVQAENPQFTGWEKEFLDTVAARVKSAYPDKFENPRRNDPGGVEPGGAGTGRRSATKKTWGDLPSDAKEQFQLLKRHGMTQQEFVSEYFNQAPFTAED